MASIDHGESRVCFRRSIPKLGEFVVGYACFNKLDISPSHAQIQDHLTRRRKAINDLFGEKSLHRTTALCRLFIDIVARDSKVCIAAPAPIYGNNDPTFTFISEKTVIRTNEFKNILRFLSIKVNSFQQITPVALQSCLTFTIQHWLAPNWNKVGGKLIEGSQFLNGKGRLYAIDWELNIQADEMLLSLAASQTYGRPTEADDFIRDGRSLKRLYEEKGSVFCGPEDSNRCIVLPSEKEATLLSVCASLPSSSPFPSREELYENWKLAYGYENVDGQGSSHSAHLYGNVQFRPCGQVFSYPLACVRQNPYFYNSRCHDDKKIICHFLSDMARKASSVWSTLLDFTQEPAHRPHCSLVEGGESHGQSSFLTPTVLKQRSCFSQRSDPVVSSLQRAVSSAATAPAQPITIQMEQPPTIPQFMSKNERIKLTFARRAAGTMNTATTTTTTSSSSSSQPNAIFSCTNLFEKPTPNKPVKLTFMSHKGKLKDVAKGPGLKNRSHQALRETSSKVKGAQSSSSATARKATRVAAKEKPSKEEELGKAEALFAAGMLSKASVPLLYKWLKSKGRKVSRQDKKADLLEHAKALVNESAAPHLATEP